MSFSFRSPNKAAGGVRDRPDRLIRSGMTGIVVIDSVAALTSKAEIEGETGESKTGHQARLVSQALRKLTAGIGEIRTIRIFIDWLPLGRVSQGVALGGLSYCSMTGKRLLCRQRAARCSLRSGRLGIIPFRQSEAYYRSRHIFRKARKASGRSLPCAPFAFRIAIG